MAIVRNFAVVLALAFAPALCMQSGSDATGGTVFEGQSIFFETKQVKLSLPLQKLLGIDDKVHIVAEEKHVEEIPVDGTGKEVTAIKDSSETRMFQPVWLLPCILWCSCSVILAWFLALCWCLCRCCVCSLMFAMDLSFFAAHHTADRCEWFFCTGTPLPAKDEEGPQGTTGLAIPAKEDERSQERQEEMTEPVLCGPLPSKEDLLSREGQEEMTELVLDAVIRATDQEQALAMAEADRIPAPNNAESGDVMVENAHTETVGIFASEEAETGDVTVENVGTEIHSVALNSAQLRQLPVMFPLHSQRGLPTGSVRDSDSEFGLADWQLRRFEEATTD